MNDLQEAMQEATRMAEPKESLLSPATGSTEKMGGVMIPLFSIRSASDCGIGEILDLIPFMNGLVHHHLRVLQILPIYEMAPTETSPYKALSSFAIDPVYLSLHGRGGLLEKLDNTPPGQNFFSSDIKACVAEWRASDGISYGPIRAFKLNCLQQAFQSFRIKDCALKTEQGAAFKAFIEKTSDWLHDYALFRLLKEKEDWQAWSQWPPPLRNREPLAMQQLEQREADSLLFFKYVQWVLREQWQRVRRHAKEMEVQMMGDLPFLPSRDSADVWCRQNEFSDDLSVGVPPDDFNAEGQKWGLPLFLWDEMKRNNLRWWRLRIREARGLYDLLRLDHVVGFFRTWVTQEEGEGYFEPSDVALQRERGEAILQAILEEVGDLSLIAEDLGIIPGFVREALERNQIPGHKVLRWERSEARYKEPKDYPLRSLATTGTHDTSPLAGWWETLPREDRKGFLEMLGSSEVSLDAPYSMRLHQEIVDRILASRSYLVMLPIQDLLAVDDQINLPGTEGPQNWRYRLPFNSSDLAFACKTGISSLRDRLDRYGRGKRSTV